MEDDDYYEPMSQAAARSNAAFPAHNFGGSDSLMGLPDERTQDATDVPRPAVTAGLAQGRRRHGKMFNCPVHGLMRMDPVFCDFIDTRYFQRTRELHQLGLTYYIFPGATHKRFEHQLGVAHKAYQWADRIYNLQVLRRKEVEMDRQDIMCVGLAGLCHDLGHGPFSHVFDREFLRAKGITNWEHEDMSCEYVDVIRDDYHIEGVSDDQAKLVKQLIKGHRHEVPEEKRFLFDIVANHRNNIDVDKADYLARDAMYCGVKVSCDFDRLIQFSKVVDNQICFKWSEYMNLYELFHSRSTMHRRVYTHRKAKSIEFMVVDALLQADVALGVTDMIWDPRQFVNLNDNLLNTIETYHVFHRRAVDDGVDGPLRKAQELVRRIRDRKLYRYINEVVVTNNTFKDPTELDIASWYSGGDVSLRPEDIIVSRNKISWSMGAKNPLDYVGFFDHYDDTVRRELRPEQMCSMKPEAFEEIALRVYSRNPDEAVCAAINQAFETWVKKNLGTKVEMATPLKKGGGRGAGSSGGGAGGGAAGFQGGGVGALMTARGLLAAAGTGGLSNDGVSQDGFPGSSFKGVAAAAGGPSGLPPRGGKRRRSLQNDFDGTGPEQQ